MSNRALALEWELKPIIVGLNEQTAPTLVGLRDKSRTACVNKLAGAEIMTTERRSDGGVGSEWLRVFSPDPTEPPVEWMIQCDINVGGAGEWCWRAIDRGKLERTIGYLRKWLSFGRPKWDSETLTLTYRNWRKKYGRDAASQAAVLDAFEELGWPGSIGAGDVDKIRAKEFKSVVGQLNDSCGPDAKLVFSLDGLGIHWSPAE